MLKRRFFNLGTILRRLNLGLICTIILLSISYTEIFAQKTRSEPPPLKERIFFGGSFGLSFGTVTDIDVSPIVGIWLLPRLNIAVGPKYEYYKYYNERADFYGGRVYSQFFFIKDLDNIIPAGIHLGFFLHAEDEFFELNYTDGTDSVSPFINTPLVGVGISEPLGRRASVNIMFLWPLENYYGLYSEPEFRISFTF